MADKEFNLLREKWIRVMRPDGATEEVSMLALFETAHQYRALAGELPTQDIALMRVLLAVLHAVFARYDPDGDFSELRNAPDALARWRALWTRGAFPYAIIKEYLEYFEERFYLFHPTRPFYQVAGMGRATAYAAAKLNGVLSESSNKVRLFPARTGREKDRIAYPEAARWLIHVNAFDDTSGKSTMRGTPLKLPSPGAGWLGRLGLIYAAGDNLFETLMLNLMLTAPNGETLWGEEMPTWELETPRTAERTEIPMPDNLSELYTLQSRRLLLKREGDHVTGYLLLGGDFFPRENAFIEQMTVWRTEKQKNLYTHTPRRHDPARQLWRDFSELFSQEDFHMRPGIVEWIAMLQNRSLIDRGYIQFQVAGVKYGDQDFFVDDVMRDSIALNAGLLSNLGGVWVPRIVSEIRYTDLLVGHVAQLAQSIAKAAGDADGFGSRRTAREQAYDRLDLPFRAWLAGIDPEVTEIDDACDAWWAQAQKIVRALGAELVHKAGPKAFTGRTVTENKKEKRYAAPEAYNWFLYNTSARQVSERRGKNGKRGKADGDVRKAAD